MNINKVRNDFPLLKKKVSGKKIVYFDNAATSLKPFNIINSEKKYYECNCSNINRGIHELSEKATIDFEETRKNTSIFFGSKKEEVIFTKNTTESINLLAYSLMNTGFFNKKDKIVLSEMEHHSNIVPWQFVAKKTGARIEFSRIKNDFEIDLNDFERKVKGAKLVSISGASNTISTKPNLREIEKITHENNCLLSIDSAQLVPHEKINFKKMNFDFMSFSAHKMLGPTGVGCLIGKKELLDEMQPFIFGGDMIQSVSTKKSVFEVTPKKFEAGTPNIAGVISFNEAIKYLQKIGFDEIKKQDHILKKKCLDSLKELEKFGLNVISNTKKNSAPIILLDYNKISCHDLAILLNDNGIAVRSGYHCAEPIIKKFNKNGLTRASFYFYNTKEEIDYFSRTLENILKKIH